MEKLLPRTLHTSQTGQGLAQRNCTSQLPVNHQISFTKSKVKLAETSMCNINYPKFSCNICAENVNGNDKAVQ